MNDLISRGMQHLFPHATIDAIESAVSKIKREGGLLLSDTAFILVSLPEGPLEIPQIMAFYAEGGAREMKQQLVDFLRAKGYNRFRAVNISGAPDPVWQRTFRHPEVRSARVATMFDFEIEGK